MNGKLLKDVKDIFEAIVLPHVENIKEDIKDINKKMEKVTNGVVNNRVEIKGNKKDIQNTKNNSRNYILLAGLIFAGITLLIKLFWK